MESLSIKLMSECTLTDVLQAWNEGFKGYYANVAMTADAFLARMANESLSAEHSVVAFADGVPAGIIVNGFRTIGGERVAWNGGTAVAPEHRRRGVARELLEASFELYRKQQVTLATLEAIEDNVKAIALYKDMGYSVAGSLLIMQRKAGSGEQAANSEEAPHASGATDAAAGMAIATGAAVRYTVRHCRPQEAARLDFYEPLTPWQTQWASVRDGEAVVLCDEEGNAAAYAIFKRVFDAGLAHASTTLYQCAVQAGRPDREALLRRLLGQVLGAEAGLPQRAFNIPADHEAIALLQEAGFETNVSQVYMTRRV
ncbi:hypothetical protein SD70_17515 [Gordoniibacillus kamchatkensis]|uniref:N-acetyltransferase domain-containing protein n=1 Tax=Gordoniibacillus kamchatkensis TaxID=1590651 RepID=A0ABR5AFR4_9BACL|nr:GNAT family N-acetyltransferase [Paenibacillus sp. VKM B-2647]KIL39859.1 hypothetical protein SD70_17515 [Paenibacillus sp. VKM B-2647]